MTRAPARLKESEFNMLRLDRLELAIITANPLLLFFR